MEWGRPPTPVLGEVSHVELDPSTTEVATIVPQKAIPIYSMATGKIKAIHVTQGQHVAQGDLLFDLDVSSLQKHLSEGNLVSSEKGIQDFLSYQISRATVYAPFNAEVLSIHVSVGAWIHGRHGTLISSPVMTLIPDSSERPLFIQIRDAEMSNLKPGMPAKIQLLGDLDRIHAGQIGPFDIPEDPSDFSRIPVLLQDPAVSLQTGDRFLVNVSLFDPCTCLCVPIHAVFRRMGRDVVFVYHKGIYQEREVSLGRMNSEHIEVLSGVVLGEKVSLQDPVLFKRLKVQRL